MRTAMTTSLTLVLVVGQMLPFLAHSYPGKQLPSVHNLLQGSMDISG